MAVKRIGAETLLELAIETLRSEIAPTLQGSRRYEMAMVLNALEIARRDIGADAEAPAWALLDDLYEPGEGSLAQLALDIRSGSVSEAKNPDLGKRLLTLLEAELALTNPGFRKLSP